MKLTSRTDSKFRTPLGWPDANASDGVDVVQNEQTERRVEEASEDIDLNPSAGCTPETDNDPVRVYLREMGVSPPLAREGEVELAKRIERGHPRTHPSDRSQGAVQAAPALALPKAQIVLRRRTPMSENGWDMVQHCDLC